MIISGLPVIHPGSGEAPENARASRLGVIQPDPIKLACRCPERLQKCMIARRGSCNLFRRSFVDFNWCASE